MTTDYIIPRVEIKVLEFTNAICCGYTNNVLANECLDLYKACQLFLKGTGKSFVMNFYEFQNLFIQPLVNNKREEFSRFRRKITRTKT